MLNCPADYEPQRVKIDALDSECRETLKGCIKDKLPEKLEKAMYQYYSRMPQFYGLPKDHKPGMPLCPVVSTCDSPTSNMPLLVERILNQLLRFVPAHLRDTKQCIDDLRTHHNIPENCIVASMDVVALYSNIPIQESIDVAMEALESHRDEIDMFWLEPSDVRNMLEYAPTSNYYEFEEKQYRQVRGIAMGNHLAPPLAILFMSHLEERALAEYHLKPLMYRRYIDDVILL